MQRVLEPHQIVIHTDSEQSNQTARTDLSEVRVRTRHVVSLKRSSGGTSGTGWGKQRILEPNHLETLLSCRRGSVC